MFRNSNFAPNFEEVEWAYWFGPVRLSVCLSVKLYMLSRTVRDRILKLINGISMKIKRTHIFSVGLVIAVLYPLFNPFFDFCIVNLWNLVNKITGELFELGS